MSLLQLVDIEPHITSLDRRQKGLLDPELLPEDRVGLMAETARNRHFLAEFYQDKNGKNLPSWLRPALHKMSPLFLKNVARHRALTPETTELMQRVETDFAELANYASRTELVGFRRTISVSAKAHFAIEGELLRARIREAINPERDGAREFLATLGQPIKNTYKGADTWHLMTSELPLELLITSVFEETISNGSPIRPDQENVYRLAEVTEGIIVTAKAQLSLYTGGGLAPAL